MKLLVAVAVISVLIVVTPVIAVVALLSAVAGGATPEIPLCATDGNLAAVLATIRHLQSRDNYGAVNAHASASGAYQIVDSTWNGYAGYPRAVQAPSDVQDQKAAELVRAALDLNTQTGEDSRQRLGTLANPIAAVPIYWYWPRTFSAPEWMNKVPMPEAGNTLTVNDYQQRWLDQYIIEAANGGVAGSGEFCTVSVTGWNGGPLPDHLANCAQLGWGGYINGHIPRPAMRYRPHSGHLHPAASESFDQLYAAAELAGYDLRGAGYAAAEEREATSGSSCHGVGLAVDIAVLVPGHSWSRYPTIDDAFASSEFKWVCANAERYGWIVPRWAMAAGMRCGHVVGNGHGGYIGNSPGHLEPWHIEAAAVVTTHPHFNPTTTAIGT